MPAHLPGRTTIGAISIMLLVGCSADRISQPSASSRVTAEGADHLARALAPAMADDSIRFSIRDALRTSPFARHRLLFQEFLHSPAGSRLLLGMARELREGPDKVLKEVDAMGSLEMLLPKRDDRLAWRATPDVAVAISNKWGEAPRVAYGVDGREIPMTDFQHGTARQLGFAALVVRPARGMSVRVNPQPRVPGTVVQDKTDGELAGRFVEYSAGGDSVVHQAGSLRGVNLTPRRLDEVCDETAIYACESDTQYGGGSPGQTRLGALVVIDGYDNGGYGEALELRFDTKLWQNGTLRNEAHTGFDTPADYSGFPNLPLISSIWSSGYEIEVEVWEDDGFWWDNHYDDFTIRGDSDNFPGGAIWHATGGGRCDGFGSETWPHCPFFNTSPDPTTARYWGMINFNVKW